jgi:hypothetical protein
MQNVMVANEIFDGNDPVTSNNLRVDHVQRLRRKTRPASSPRLLPYFRIESE